MRRSTSTEVTQLLAAWACTLCAGAAVHINLVEPPARMKWSTELAASIIFLLAGMRA
ncbi:MAG: hypothetical protein ACREOO_15515 [bacterium]